MCWLRTENKRCRQECRHQRTQIVELRRVFQNLPFIRNHGDLVMQGLDPANSLAAQSTFELRVIRG